jgi:choline dehydrogenase
MSGGFINVMPGETIPDVQFHFVPGLILDHGRKLTYGNGISLHACTLRP